MNSKDYQVVLQVTKRFSKGFEVAFLHLTLEIFLLFTTLAVHMHMCFYFYGNSKMSRRKNGIWDRPPSPPEKFPRAFPCKKGAPAEPRPIVLSEHASVWTVGSGVITYQDAILSTVFPYPLCPRYCAELHDGHALSSSSYKCLSLRG